MCGLVALAKSDRCDALLFDDMPPPACEEEVRLSMAAKLVADRITSAINNDSIEDRVLAEILATGYLVMLSEDRPGHTDHIGSLPAEVCDFCGTKEITGRVKAPTFWAPVIGNRPGDPVLCYEGVWTHCSGCAAAVEKKDHVELARRAVTTKPASAEFDPVRRRKYFEGLYQKVLDGVTRG